MSNFAHGVPARVHNLGPELLGRRGVRCAQRGAEAPPDHAAGRRLRARGQRRLRGPLRHRGTSAALTIIRALRNLF